MYLRSSISTNPIIDAGTQSWSIVQDDQGILYFANNKGVLVFDATRWELVEMPNQTVVRSLAYSEESAVIYVGAQNELGRLIIKRLRKRSDTSLCWKDIPDDLLNFEDVWKIFPYESGVYFCSQKAILRWQDSQWDVLQPKGRFENFFFAQDQLFAQDIGEGLVQLKGW